MTNQQPAIAICKPPLLTTATNLRYKFVELSVVTDDSLESAVNHWVAQGWQLDGIYFVTTEASRRPAMAFVSFVRDRALADADADANANANTNTDADPNTKLAGTELADSGAPEEVSDDEPTGVFFE